MSEAPPPPPPPGYVRLTVQGNRMLSMMTPSVRINGYAVPAQYGPNVYPMPPGIHTVSAHTQWLWQYGQAAQPVQVVPGQLVEVYYAAPVLTFLRGAMGFERQQIPGMLAFVLLLALVGAVAIGLPLVAILASA